MADAVPASSNALVNLLANPPNPMDQLGKTANALTGAREFQAKQAIANAYSQATDPVTGEVDQGKLNAIISQGPGAFLQGQAMEQGGRGVQAQAAGTSASVAAVQDQLTAAASYMTPLIQQLMQPGGTVTTDQVNAMLDGIPPGALPGSMINNVRTKLNALGPGADASGLVRGMFFANQFALEKLKAAGPQATSVITGPNVQTFATNPLYQGPGQNLGRPGANVPLGLSPQNVTQVQQWLTEPFTWDVNGVPQQGTKGGYLQSKGIDPMQYFNNGNVPAPGSPPPSIPAGPLSSVTTGRQPVGAPTQTPAQPPQPPGAPQTVPAVPPPAPGTSVGTTSEQLPPAVVEAGQKDYIAAQAASQTMNTRIAPLRNALSILRTNPDLQTGAGVAQWNQAVTGAAAALNLPVPQGTSDNQELTKYLAQYVRNQNTGGQTDLGRLETEAANPNPTTQSREALQVLTAKAVGVERLRTAALDYFNSQFPDATTAARNSGRYTVMTTDWMKRQDPTAYAVDAMTPEQVARYFNGLTGTVDKSGKATGDKAAFYRSMQDARRLYGASMQPNPNATTVPPPSATPAPPPPVTPRVTPPPPAFPPYGSGSAPPPGP